MRFFFLLTRYDVRSLHASLVHHLLPPPHVDDGHLVLAVLRQVKHLLEEDV